MGKVKERWQKIKTFFQEVKIETKKVTWPNKTELMSYTITVLVSMVLLAMLLGLGDKFISTIIGLIIR